MTELSADPQAETRFAAVLTPHRSLSPKGFAVLMTLVCIVSFGTGLLFYLLGAWPVVGFMGLDVALIYIAFKLNYRAARLYETVDLTPSALTVTRVQPSGKAQHLASLAAGDVTGQVRSWIEMVLPRAPQPFTGKLNELVTQLD